MAFLPKRPRNAISLWGILLVLVVVLIAATLLFPALRCRLIEPEVKTQAKNDACQIATAISADLATSKADAAAGSRCVAASAAIDNRISSKSPRVPILAADVPRESPAASGAMDDEAAHSPSNAGRNQPLSSTPGDHRSTITTLAATIAIVVTTSAIDATSERPSRGVRTATSSPTRTPSAASATDMAGSSDASTDSVNNPSPYGPSARPSSRRARPGPGISERPRANRRRPVRPRRTSTVTFPASPACAVIACAREPAPGARHRGRLPRAAARHPVHSQTRERPGLRSVIVCRRLR